MLHQFNQWLFKSTGDITFDAANHTVTQVHSRTGGSTEDSRKSVSLTMFLFIDSYQNFGLLPTSCNFLDVLLQHLYVYLKKVNEKKVLIDYNTKNW